MMILAGLLGLMLAGGVAAAFIGGPESPDEDDDALRDDGSVPTGGSGWIDTQPVPETGATAEPPDASVPEEQPDFGQSDAPWMTPPRDPDPGVADQESGTQSSDAPIIPVDLDLWLGDEGGILSGGGGQDSLFGGAGADMLHGREGDDTLSGGAGDDLLLGEAGDDALAGGEGRDTLRGEIGNDRLDGGAGDDDLAGGAGDDLLDGGDGADRLLGGDGRDTLSGGAGDDLLDGGWGDDLLLAGEGDDTLLGGAGNDTLRASDVPGTQQLDGGAGDDRLHLAGGSVAQGGAGADAFVVDGVPEGELPRIIDFAPGEDSVVIGYDPELGPPAELEVLPDPDQPGGLIVVVEGQPMLRVAAAGRDLVPEDLGLRVEPEGIAA